MIQVNYSIAEWLREGCFRTMMKLEATLANFSAVTRLMMELAYIFARYLYAHDVKEWFELHTSR
jgi:hypothetical protein